MRSNSNVVWASSRDAARKTKTIAWTVAERIKRMPSLPPDPGLAQCAARRASHDPRLTQHLSVCLGAIAVQHARKIRHRVVTAAYTIGRIVPASTLTRISLLVFAVIGCSANPDFDLVILGGSVIDGTGAGPRDA